MKLEKYEKIVNKNSKKEDKTKNVIIAFIIGGLLGVICEAFACALQTWLYMPPHEAYMYTMIMLVIVSSILTGLGFFDKVVSFAKCGLIVPTTGFAHAMTSAAMDHESEGPIKGIGSNIFKLTGSIILYGLVAAFFPSFNKRGDNVTLKFNNTYIKNFYTLLGRNEHNIKLKVDEKIKDYYNGEKSVEMGETSYQIKSTKGLMRKEKTSEKNIDLLIGGDLQNQLLASNFSARKFNIPFLGIYSACATFTEGLILAGTYINNKQANNIIVNTSAHNLASEKQFRFPIEYGALRKKVNTFTATGSVSTLISNTPTNIKIESATIGKVIDLGYTDANNMGACMAPSAGEALNDHFKETNRTPDYYDLILTGDLGVYGVEILKDYLEEKYKIKANNIKDAGVLLFEEKTGGEIAGGSGPVCLPLILFSKILKENYKKILLVGTGSLHSKVSTNLSESIPSISHIVSLEVMKQ